MAEGSSPLVNYPASWSCKLSRLLVQGFIKSRLCLCFYLWCLFLSKTPPRKGPRERKKSVPPPAHASEIHVCEPTPAKTPSSRSKAKEKGRKSKQDSGKARGPSGKLLREDSIAEIIYRLQNLNLGDKSREQEQNALVLYRGDGAVVPYELKKRKPRPKVELDDETTRIWNLLMGKGEKEGDEEMDKKKEKWWEEERNVFRGRADSFIARMHLVQGEYP